MMQLPCPLFHDPNPDPSSFVSGRKLRIPTDDGTLVVRPWPRPATWRNGRQIAWEGFQLHFQLRYPDEYGTSAGESTPWDELIGPRAEFFRCIPLMVREALCLYRFHQPRVLWFLGHCDGAIDLVCKNPALALALAMHTRFHEPVVKRPLPAARRWVWRKQRDVAEWLGFPATERAREVLAKVTKPARGFALLHELRDSLWNDDKAKLLGRLPKVNAAAAQMVADDRLFPHITPALMAEVADAGELEARVYIHGHLREVVEMAEALRGYGMRPRIPRFRTAARLHEVHENYLGRLARHGHGSAKARLRRRRAEEARHVRWKKRMLALQFPEPPLRGTEDIVPVRDGHQLAEEGAQMRNSFLHHAQDVAEGRAYVYSMKQPREATILLKKMDGMWLIKEANERGHRRLQPGAKRSMLKWYVLEAI